MPLVLWDPKPLRSPPKVTIVHLYVFMGVHILKMNCSTEVTTNTHVLANKYKIMQLRCCLAAD